MNRPAILLLEPNDWDREHIRDHLQMLTASVRILESSQIDNPGNRVDIIILGLSDAVSLETARAQLTLARERSPKSQLIVCAPRETEDLDSKILELGARAFVLKPVDADTFTSLLEETLAQISLRMQREAYAKSAKKSSKRPGIVGTSDAIRSVLELIERVAESSNTSVLLLGESGVGKSLFAQTIHEQSAQARGPFIEINCATLPPQLLESELFGYEPGAFTDARSRKLGLIELASGGTLFLDEITEVDLATQAKLLKVLDSKRFRRLGGDTEISVDIRVVAATNREMRQAVQLGEFRKDLYYRLNVVEIYIPPLRERREDVDLIAAHYFELFRRKFNKPDLELSADSWESIRDYGWPGNVRELINVLERAVLLSKGSVVQRAELPIEKRAPRKQAAIVIDDTLVDVSIPDDGVSLDRVEKCLIEETLKRARGNVSKAAAMLRISRGALRNKLTRHGIDPLAFRARILVES